MLVFSRFQEWIWMEWPAKQQQTDFDAICTKPKRRRALDLQSRQNRQKLLQGASRGTLPNAGIFQVPTVDSDGMACESTNRPTLMRLTPNPRSGEPSTCRLGTTPKDAQWAKQDTFANAGIFQDPSGDSGGMACKSTNIPTLMRFTPNPRAREPLPCSRGKPPKSCSRDQNDVLLLMLVFSRFYQSFGWNGLRKYQQTDFEAICPKPMPRRALDLQSGENRQNEALLLMLKFSRFKQ